MRMSGHKYGNDGMGNYLVCILVRRTPVFRAHFHESIVSKEMMDVTRGRRRAGVQDECIRVNGVLAHPLREIDNAQGDRPV